eukprot:gene10763-3382_t
MGQQAQLSKCPLNLMFCGSCCALIHEHVCHVLGMSRKYSESFMSAPQENYVKKITSKRSNFELNLWDSPNNFDETHLYILHFNAQKVESFERLKNTWIPRIKKARKRRPAPLILVGFNIQIGYGLDTEVSQEDIKEVSKELNSLEYIEIKSLKNGVCLEKLLNLTLKYYHKSKENERLPSQIVQQIWTKLRLKK